MTDAPADGRAARYLAEAGRVLEQFDPQTSLHAILELAVPALADAGFIHLNSAGQPVLAAAVHRDPAVTAELANRIGTPEPLRAETAIARVLAGGPPELVLVDEEVLAEATHDAAHLAMMRSRGYRCSVVAPLAGRDGTLGTVTFSLIAFDRSYGPDDLAMLVELARRTGIALENHRLFLAEQQARRQAEEARDRTHRLYDLTAKLSGALDEAEVTHLMVSAGASALGAAGAFAWLLRRDAVLELAAAEDRGARAPVAEFTEIPLTAHLPICDVVRTGIPRMFEDVAAMNAAYPGSAAQTEFRAWAVLPFVVAETAIGAVSFSFTHERTFSDDDRELIVAMMGQASLALERCKLLEAERRARTQAEAARLREQQMHGLASRMSTALTTAQVAVIVSEGAVAAIGAYTALAALRTGDVLQMVGAIGARNQALLAQVLALPVSAAMPLAEAVRRNELVWCADRAAITAKYPQSPELARTVQACGAVPFTFEGRVIGALALGCDSPRHLTAEDRETLHAIGQLAAQAFERARLYEALRASEDRLRDAMRGARAGTWLLDLHTMKSKRDASYAALLSVENNEPVNADFGHVHPDDRERTRAAFERAMRDGVPYNPECRIQCADGSYRWFRSFARVLDDANGNPAVMTGIVFDIDDEKRASLAAEEERRINETLYRLGASFASELDHDRLVKRITDELAPLIGAEVAVFSTTDEGAHDRIAQMSSFVAIPIIARSGEDYGALLFGHSEPGKFTEHRMRLAASVASQAAIALENARLYRHMRRHEEELEAAVARARVADRRKDEFLAMLGHELRNPLAPIATALDLMDLKSAGTLEKERQVIRRQVEHMTRLIDDLLDVSRITRGKIQLTKQVLELSVVVAKAIELASPLLEKRMQRLAVDVPREGLLVDADATRLAQVFQNLLTNASKYSDPQAEIAIRAQQLAGEVVVDVTDAGIGIGPELMPRLFELFVQGERAIDRADGGLGLGLTIAKSLCDLHGGSIDARSAGVGHGSSFTVRLPLAPQPSIPISERATEKMPKLSRGARVLVVDDNVDTAARLREYLSDLGHEPAIAHDGVAALELLATFRPEVAVLDIGLPVMDGYELARRLREKLGADKLRLIAMTGYGDEPDRTRANEAGFDHHLVKPVALDALTALLDRVR